LGVWLADGLGQAGANNLVGVVVGTVGVGECGGIADTSGTVPAGACAAIAGVSEGLGAGDVGIGAAIWGFGTAEIGAAIGELAPGAARVGAVGIRWGGSRGVGVIGEVAWREAVGDDVEISGIRAGGGAEDLGVVERLGPAVEDLG